MVGRLAIWLFDPLDAHSDHFACSMFGRVDAWSLVASTLALMLLLAQMLFASIVLIAQMFACLIIWLFGPFDARLDYFDFARWDAAQWDVAHLRRLVVWMLGCLAGRFDAFAQIRALLLCLLHSLLWDSTCCSLSS
jgi:hypothetical protein